MHDELPRALWKMNDAVAHRGPDDEGYLFVNRQSRESLGFSGPSSPSEINAIMSQISEGDVSLGSLAPDLALGHRRFSIIAPTPDGHQPFMDSTGRVALIFNGEIYNYVEVREELKRLGHSFRTESDTEVIVEAYLEWGDACFEHLNGMWAIALYDCAERDLILCRDRTGERPLYWVRRPEGIWFASEIRALLFAKAARVMRETNDDAAYNFLYQASADLDVHTFFRDIDSLPQGTAVRINTEGAITERRFWRVPQSRPDRNPRSVSDLVQELRTLLRDSVRIRLRADVPVNVALSGGMDSSSVVAMAAGIKGVGLATYTVRFKEEQWNEYPFAAMVAERYQVDNFVIDPPGEWMWGHLESFVDSMEEPFHAPDLLPDHVIRRMLAARGIRVSLSGIGGDELFAGYEHYRQLHILDLKREGRRGAALKHLVFASHFTPLEGAARLVQGKLRGMIGDGGSSRADFWNKAFSSSKRPVLRELPGECSERLSADVEWSLLPYWLRAGDKSSMAIPIEVRYPFLDHRLIEFASQLPIDLLIRDGWMKWFLRKAMEELLPREVVWRRRKMGFPFPIVEWLRGASEELRSIFNEMDNPFLSRDFWKNHFAEMSEFDPWLTWRALSFELWHRHFIRGLPVFPAKVRERTSVMSVA